ncbi:uncharacterized protein EDB91DRAFT_1255924 [Suillus paluster]|uniref:uncharacterized protein n=1 Tax=Suillus paluster TaxID=48578 RepID=UPI001B862571|nr:uncharacterized protein EDB91DRAFT_1255924 [Suillus paluster]KAG1722727.1 hypothetical protein EDB91DRAFT_1255924 [Suillus paluster]
MPRFRYDLEGLTPEQQDAERKRLWLVRQMQDPEKAEKIRARNRESKRAQRQRTKQSRENTNPGAEPPRFRRQRAPEPAEASSSQPTPPNSFDPNLIHPALQNPAHFVPPRQMSEAAVMTDPHPSYPPRQTINRNLDLASDILGIQVPQQSKTITWADGCKTVLPCVMNRGVNICEENDAAFVRFLSIFPESKPSSTHVVHINNNRFNRDQLQQLVSIALRHDRPAVIRGTCSHVLEEIDAEYLEKHFGISPLMRVTIHDVAERIRDFSHPHLNGTIQQFVEAIDDPSKIQCILDIPLSHFGIPQDFQLLDHGLVYGWNQTTVDCPISSGKVHPDNFTVKSWALLHQGGFVTYPHHNSDGAITVLRVEAGAKLWIVFRTKKKLNRTALQKAQMLFANFAQNRDAIMEIWEAEVIRLLPGDLLFQPAGQVHAVYTPVPSFATGGHFYNYESLHLTELSRYIDARKAQFLTNQVHDNTLETFHRMTLALPRLSPSVRLYHRAVIGLCLMIVNRDKHKASNNDSGYQIVASESTGRALTIAKTIINHFYNNTEAAQRAYRSGDQSDAGELVSREELSSCLQSFTHL